MLTDFFIAPWFTKSAWCWQQLKQKRAPDGHLSMRRNPHSSSILCVFHIECMTWTPPLCLLASCASSLATLGTHLAISRKTLMAMGRTPLFCSVQWDGLPLKHGRPPKEGCHLTATLLIVPLHSGGVGCRFQTSAAMMQLFQSMYCSVVCCKRLGNQKSSQIVSFFGLLLQRTNSVDSSCLEALYQWFCMVFFACN